MSRTYSNFVFFHYEQHAECSRQRSQQQKKKRVSNFFIYNPFPSNISKADFCGTSFLYLKPKNEILFSHFFKYPSFHFLLFREIWKIVFLFIRLFLILLRNVIFFFFYENRMRNANKLCFIYHVISCTILHCVF